jgi:hypothetical protein
MNNTDPLSHFLVYGVILSLSIFSGCDWHSSPYSDASIPAIQVPAVTPDAGAIKSQEIIFDTSTWRTYTVDEFGFRFKLPREWKLLYNEDEPGKKSMVWYANSSSAFSLDITFYDDTPESLGNEGDNMGYTKGGLDIRRKEIDSNTSSSFIGGFKVLKDVDLSVPEGDLMATADFFVGKDLVSLSINLPFPEHLIAMPEGDDKKGARIAYLNDVKNNNMNNEIRQLIGMWDNIVSTILMK